MSSLREWLVSIAGLEGKKLEAALSAIDKELIGACTHAMPQFGALTCVLYLCGRTCGRTIGTVETVDELRVLRTKGQLGEVHAWLLCLLPVRIITLPLPQKVFKQKGLLLAIETALEKEITGAGNQSAVEMVPMATVVAVDDFALLPQATTLNPLVVDEGEAQETDNQRKVGKMTKLLREQGMQPIDALVCTNLLVRKGIDNESTWAALSLDTLANCGIKQRYYLPVLKGLGATEAQVLRAEREHPLPPPPPPPPKTASTLSMRSAGDGGSDTEASRNWMCIFCCCSE
jgi:hypothetical protein